MHYRSDAFGFDVLAPVEDFLELDSHWMRYETDTLEIHENMRHSVAGAHLRRVSRHWGAKPK